MKRKVVSGIVVTLLLIGMLTLAFNIQRAESSEPPAQGITEPYLPPVDGGVCHNMDNMDALWIPYTGYGGWNSWYHSDERFTPSSIYYQAWVGIYWIRGYVEPTPEDVLPFSIIDQMAWLQIYGDPNPYCEVKDVLEVSPINFRGYDATLIRATMNTHTDISPYGNITLSGYVIVFYNETLDRTAVIYVAAVEANYDAALPMMESLVDGMQIPIDRSNQSVFSDDFNDGDISDWTVTTTGDAVFEVSTGKCVSSPYSVHMNSVGNHKAIGVSPSCDLNLSEDYDVSFYFLIPHTDNHWFEVFNNRQIYLVIDYGDDLKCYNETSYLISELATDQWYHIEIKAHPSSNNYDVYVNGTFKRTCPMWIHGTYNQSFRIGDRADGSTDRGEAYWDDFNIYQGRHDIAVIDVVSLKTIVCQGYNTRINVTVENQGNFTETFNVTAYTNTTTIRTIERTLTSGNSIIVTFTWNTTGFVKGNYTISANITTMISGEIDTADNFFTDSTVRVNMVGDLNSDSRVSISDIVIIALAFGSELGDPHWNPNADLNDDGKVTISDVVIAALHFGETDC